MSQCDLCVIAEWERRLLCLAVVEPVVALVLAVVNFDHVLHLLEAGHSVADSLNTLESLIRLELHVFDTSNRQKRVMSDSQ
jgi:hypothetical protein